MTFVYVGIVYLQDWQLRIIITHQEHQNDLNKLPKSYEMIGLAKICSKNRKICFLLVLKISQNIQNIVIKKCDNIKLCFFDPKNYRFEHVLTGHRNEEYTNTHLVVLFIFYLVVRVGRVGLLPYVVFVFRIRIIEILPWISDLVDLNSNEHIQ